MSRSMIRTWDADMLDWIDRKGAKGVPMLKAARQWIILRGMALPRNNVR